MTEYYGGLDPVQRDRLATHMALLAKDSMVGWDRDKEPLFPRSMTVNHMQLSSMTPVSSVTIAIMKTEFTSKARHDELHEKRAELFKSSFLMQYEDGLMKGVPPVRYFYRWSAGLRIIDLAIMPIEEELRDCLNFSGDHTEVLRYTTIYMSLIASLGLHCYRLTA